MNNIYIFIFLLIFAELLEAYIQKSDTIFGIFEKLYMFFKKSIFIFFLMQPSFYILLAIILLTNILNGLIIFMLLLKVFDIFYKLEMIKKIFIKQQISDNTKVMLDTKVSPVMFLLGVVTYPPLLFYALV